MELQLWHVKKLHNHNKTWTISTLEVSANDLINYQKQKPKTLSIFLHFMGTHRKLRWV